MKKIARGIAASTAVLVALAVTVVVAPAALADSTTVRSDVQVVAVHATDGAGVSLEELAFPVSSVCSETTEGANDDHWFD